MFNAPLYFLLLIISQNNIPIYMSFSIPETTSIYMLFSSDYLSNLLVSVTQNFMVFQARTSIFVQFQNIALIPYFGSIQTHYLFPTRKA